MWPCWTATPLQSRPPAGAVAERTGQRTLAVPADVRVRAKMERAVATTLAAFGRLDVFVANAGVWSHGLLTEVPEREWDRVFAVNLKGVLFGIQGGGARTEGSAARQDRHHRLGGRPQSIVPLGAPIPSRSRRSSRSRRWRPRSWPPSRCRSTPSAPEPWTPT